MHPFHDHTLILIDIQAPNQLEILTCIRETFEYMPGWQVMSSVHQSSTDSRFFAFNLTEHTFEWWRTNDTFSDTMDEDEVPIKDLADISHLLEFVWINCEKLREKEDLAKAFAKLFADPPSLPKKKRKKDEPVYPKVHKLRQGTNYWFKHVTGENIAKAVKKGGMFVFNTFGNKPTEEPMVKEYFHGGKKYKEVSFLFEGRIHHVQTAEGMEPHFTVFDWISHDEYTQKLAPYFITEEVVDGPSSMWYCWKV